MFSRGIERIFVDPTHSIPSKGVGTTTPDFHRFHSDRTEEVDFCIALGGDGTLLHMSTLFPDLLPPVIGFGLGTLGFLLPFRIHLPT